MAQAYLQRMTPQTMMLTLLSCLACLYVAGRCVRIPIEAAIPHLASGLRRPLRR